MAIRLLPLVVVTFLSGCASLYMGPALSTCKHPAADPKLQPKGCMTGADYDIARKKAQHDLRKSAADQDE